MKKIIEKILNEYVSSKKEPFAEHPMGDYIRNKVPQEIYGSNIVDSSKYLIKGSVGQGNWASVPWVAIFDKDITTSAKEGVYIVYLLKRDGSSLYLTLNQGCTDIREGHSKGETIRILRKNANELVTKINARGFKSDENIFLGNNLTEIAELYQKGTIFYKEYKKDNVPEENELRNDLAKMVEIYKEYAGKQIKHFTGVIDSWEIIDENTAIKTCDKSFFEYNMSGIPKEISWFFEAEDLQQGESRDIMLLYNGVEYSGRISNDSSDHHRIRIVWNSKLGKIFNVDRGKEIQKLQFCKNGDSYSICFIGGEEELQGSAKDFIQQIKEYIAAKGFSYSDKLIENFYLSLKSKPFVILAGTSGTGKTRLVKLFSEAIGAEYKLVSVRPDWSDGSDLFGHYDLNGNFIDGPVCECFNLAYENPNKPVFLCLDEMNLARVEYYLSDFLSVIESREKNPEGKVVTSSIAQYKEGIPDNLYIVGTVNMDETTFPFSKKELDRANTIEFSYVDLVPTFGELGEISEKLHLSNSFLCTEYLVLSKDCFEEQEYVQEICAELQAINEILVKANAHVGYRVRDEIVFYLLNNKAADNLLTHKEAFDNEIMQKILPRIQGSSGAVKTLLIELFKFCFGSKEGIDPDTGKVGEQMQSVSGSAKYPASAEKIGYMMTRYEEDGFTSYWL